ncbi:MULTISPECIES: EpsG family protein [Flavobacterium]|nr:EpsG family protein [Flavobacterium sp. N1846]
MIAFFFGVVLSGLAFFFKRSKIILLILFVFMWLLFGWNYSNADRRMYTEMYSVSISKIEFLKFEGGYSFLMFCSRYLGLSLQEFLIIVSGIVLLFIFRFFYIFSNVPAFVGLCFLWFFFPLEYVVLRNFIAFSIVLQGFISVFRNEKYYREKFVLCVLLASTIHISSLMYLIFLLAFKENEIKIKTIVFWVIGLLTIVLVSHDLIFRILSIYSKDKVIFYTTSLSLFLFYSSIQIANLWIVKYFLKSDDVNGTTSDKRLNIMIVNINIVMLLLIVVYYEMAVFIRILLNMSIVNLVFITNKSILFGEKKIPKILFLSYLLFGFYCFIFLVREKTIFPLFDSNLLFK